MYIGVLFIGGKVIRLICDAVFLIEPSQYSAIYLTIQRSEQCFSVKQAHSPICYEINQDIDLNQLLLGRGFILALYLL